jgi:valyl-tRNA synthetase
MSAELSTKYDPSAVEENAYKAWLDSRAFHAEPGGGGDPYSIVIPPPNVTAALHLGHALNNTLQDILTRWRRMAGDNACWLPGTDHAGIATQTVVEKRVLAEEGRRRTDFPREEFVKKIQAWKDEYEARIIEQLKRMGCSCDWDRTAFTMDEQRAKAVREAFFRLFKDGLIYRGKRLVNWDPVTQTALADDEVEMEEVDGNFYYLRYPLSDGSDHVTVATTRPETMLGDTAVAVNPKDPRAAGLRGKRVRLPIVNREIPIVEDDYVVLPVSLGGDKDDPKAQFATGFLKVTPAHDPNDYDIGLRHGLAQINVMGPDASISEKHGWPAEDFARGDEFLKGELVGKSREEARKLVVQFFKRQGLMEEIKPYRHSVGHSYRSHVPIEPYLSDQWYCKVTDPRLAGAALRAMSADQRESGSPGITGVSPVSAAWQSEGVGSSLQSNQHGRDARDTGERNNAPRAGVAAAENRTWEGQLRFYPARYAKTFQAWHENIRDWCISRQLWWGHRIPVWVEDPSVKPNWSENQWDDFENALDSFEAYGRAAFRSQSEQSDSKLRSFRRADSGGLSYICIREENDSELIKAVEEAGFRRDPDVLDTWFSSALWPMSTLNWPGDTAELATWNPSSVLCTAREIITLWVSRMVMFNLYFLGRLPFRHVFIHPMVQDGHGQKMSKSLGNGVDPTDIIHSHGADAMRFAVASMTTNTQDVRMPVDVIDPHSGETFTPRFVTDSAGYKVAAPVQDSPKDPKKKMVSSYGLASGKAKPTAEMPLAKNTSSKFDLGRNFCNKLWNASRFALMNIGGLPASAASEPVDEMKWTLADRWIVSRYNRTVEEANAALADYRFDQYARTCYDFFWRDFCDWYVEAAKPAFKDASRAAQTAHVTAACLDGILRLMHPMIPFITETIWWRLNEVRPSRGLTGRVACPHALTPGSEPQATTRIRSPLLIHAPWPGVGDFSQAAEHIFPKLQEVIGVIRNLRNDYKVSPKERVTVSFSAPAEPARQITENREMIELLATCTIKDVKQDLAPPADAVRGSAAGVEVFIEGLAAQSKGGDDAVVQKRRSDLTKLRETLRGRMSSDSYVKKAPPHLVEQTRNQLAEVEAELAKLGES